MSKVKKIATMFFGKSMNILVNFLFLPYMSRALTYEDYGTYGQVILLVTIISSAIHLGLPQVQFVYDGEEEKKQSYLDTNWILLFGLGLIGSLLLFLFSDFIAAWLGNEKLSSLLRIIAIGIPFQNAFLSIFNRFVIESRVKEVTLITVLANILKVILVVCAVQFYDSLTLVFWAICLIQIVQFSVAVLVFGMKSIPNFSKSYALNQLKEGLPLGVTAILAAGLVYIDGVMVSKLLGVQSFAIYRNGAFEVPFVATIYTSVATIILPDISNFYRDGEFKKIIDLKKKAMMNNIVLIYPILIFLLFNSEDLIVTILGEKYRSSAIIFSLFNIILLIRGNDYHDILVAAKKSRMVMNHYAIVFIANLILNYILIHYYGIVGAALSTAICFIVSGLIILNKNLRLVNSSITKIVEFKTIIYVLLICASTAFFLYLLTASLVSRIVSLGISAVIYFAFVYFILIRFNFLSNDVFQQLLAKANLKNFIKR